MSNHPTVTEESFSKVLAINNTRKKYPASPRAVYFFPLLLLLLLFGIANAVLAQNPFLRFSDSEVQSGQWTGFQGSFSLAEDETIVWMGGENWVRQQHTGILERALLRGWSAEPPKFRSMAWEGDTVHEQYRDLNFGSWAEQFRWAGASSIWMGFGAMESLEGEENLFRFVADYNRLLDQVLEHTSRVILISPTPFEVAPYEDGPDLVAANATLEKYVSAIEEMASWRGLLFVDLFHPFYHQPDSSQKSEQETDVRLTWNGAHWSAAGQWRVAREIGKQLQIPTEYLPGLEHDQWTQWIQEKNRWWFEVWRPMNWAFMYGDRTTQLFAQPVEDQTWLREELERFQQLIRDQEKRIADAAQGRPVDENEESIPVLSRSEFEPRQDPKDTLKSFTTAPGMEVNLFAGESLGVVNPTQIAWDEAGRLYVACSPTYPHIVPGEAPADYILVCEDLDKDGIADTSWKFAEGLHMTQGMVPADGGVYVCAGTRILFFRDVDGDLRADEEQTIFSGFGTGDAHQLVNSITRGPDGFFWMTQGLHILSHIETAHGVSTLEKSGVWRWDPRTGKLDGFFNGAKAGHNCWGVAFNNDQQPFHKTGDRPHGYFMTPGWFAISDPAEYHPTGTLFQTPLKTTALDFVGTAAFPEEAQNRAVLGGFMKHTVEWYDVLDDGSGFRSEQQADLLQSTSPDFRPVDVSLGPDGAVYVCDFHNRMIGHYQHSYRDPERDHSHGRIWRVSSSGSNAELWKNNLPGNTVEDWIERLESNERWSRDQARRLLMEGDSTQVIQGLCKKASQIETERQKQLWAMQSLGIYRAHGTENLELVNALAKSEEPNHRSYAARYAGFWGQDVLLTKLAEDPHPRVRLEALVAGARLSPARAFTIWLTVFDSSRDRFLDYALINAARQLRSYWEPQIQTGQLTIKEAARNFLQTHGGMNPEIISRGRQIYESLCLTCHQPDGQGLPGVYPNLGPNSWTTKAPEKLINILLHGLSGPLTIDGQHFNNIMPPSGLSDNDIAETLNYVRTKFGKLSISEIGAETVKVIREKNTARKSFWTAEELE